MSTTAELVRLRREGGPGRTASDIAALTVRNLRVAARTPGVVVGGTAFPVFMLLVFTASVGRVVEPGGFDDFAQYLTPGMVAFGVMFGSLNSGIALVRDIDSGMLDRLHAMPIARTAALVGRLLSDAITLIVQAVLITAVGMIIGFRFEDGVPAIPAFILLPVVFAAVWSVLAMAIAIRTGSAEVIQTAVSPFFLPLGFLSLTYIPEDGFPEWAQPFARYNPLSEVIEAMRGLATGGPALDHTLAALAWSAGLGGLFAGAAVHALWLRGRER